MSNRINKKGVSLVEVMISLVILLIVSMGLLQASLLSIDSNVRNELRDEAVRIASESMAQRRSAFGDANSSLKYLIGPLETRRSHLQATQ